MNTLLKYVFFVSVLLSNTALFSQNEEFKDFWKKFKTDSLFQKSRIMFPLKYNTTYGEDGITDAHDTVIKKSEWEYKDNTFWLEFKLINTSKPAKGDKPASQERMLEYAPKEENFSSYYFFKLINGKWFLVEAAAYGC